MQLPFWLFCLASAALVIALCCCAWCLWDLCARPQPAAVLNLLWPLVLLWTGLPGLLCYLLCGRRPRSGTEPPSGKPSVLVNTLYGGLGPGLGVLLAELLVTGLPLPEVAVLRSPLFGGWALGLMLAGIFSLVLGSAFRLAEGERPSLRQALAGLFSVLLCLAGLYAVLVAGLLWLPGGLPEKLSPVCWFMLQLALLAGLVCSWPVQFWRLRGTVASPSPES